MWAQMSTPPLPPIDGDGLPPAAAIFDENRESMHFEDQEEV